MMFKCLNCDREFEEAKEYETTYERYLGVEGQVAGYTPLTLLVCPYCESDDLEEGEEDDI